jgi:hypothetical protein
LEAKRSENCEGIWRKGLSLISHTWWSGGREKESGGEDKSLGNPNPGQVVGCSVWEGGKCVCLYLGKCEYRLEKEKDSKEEPCSVLEWESRTFLFSSFFFFSFFSNEQGVWSVARLARNIL